MTDNMNQSLIKKYADNVCCCCGHSLDNHIDESEGWRCRSLGRDYFQCECFLRKNHYDSIKGYDLQKRINENEELADLDKILGDKT